MAPTSTAAGAIGSVGRSESREATRQQGKKHFDEFADGESGKPRGPWDSLTAATLCGTTVYEQFAYYLVELKKRDNTHLAAATVIAYLSVMLHAAKSKFFASSSPDVQAFFACLDDKSTSFLLRALAPRDQTQRPAHR